MDISYACSHETSLEKGNYMHTLFLVSRPSHIYGSIFRFRCFAASSSTMRYYEARYPEVDELVMVQVRQIAEMGAYVKLVRSSNFRPIPHGTTATMREK
jgi:hypothetical protein